MLYWISSSKLLFLFNLAHYERLFKDLQAQVHGEPVTGLLMIYPHHMIHVVEVRGLNGLILADFEMDLLQTVVYDMGFPRMDDKIIYEK